jgi:hypothetical protein
MAGDTAVGVGIFNQGQFMNTLMNAFKTQYGAQQGALQFLTNTLQGKVSNPTGFSPATMAALNTQAIQNSAVQAQNATQAAQNFEASHGGNGLPSGVNAQISGQINASAANQLSGELNQNQVQNGILQNQNQWTAISGLENVAQMRNPLGYAGGENSAANSLGGLDQTYLDSRKYNASRGVGGILGGLAGNAIGALAGGFGNLDSTGGSSLGEQFSNFGSGALGGLG